MALDTHYLGFTLRQGTIYVSGPAFIVKDTPAWVPSDIAKLMIDSHIVEQFLKVHIDDLYKTYYGVVLIEEEFENFSENDA